MKKPLSLKLFTFLCWIGVAGYGLICIVALIGVPASTSSRWGQFYLGVHDGIIERAGFTQSAYGPYEQGSTMAFYGVPLLAALLSLLFLRKRNLLGFRIMLVLAVLSDLSKGNLPFFALLFLIVSFRKPTRQYFSAAPSR